MSKSTYEIVKSLQDELRAAQSAEDVARLLTAVLDAHVDDVSGTGTLTLENGQTVYDAEDMLGVGASLGGRADTTTRDIPLAWLEAAPDAARLHVVAWLLPTLWGSWSPPADHVSRLLDAFKLVAPTDRETRGPLLGVLRKLETDGALAARIGRLMFDPALVPFLTALKTVDPRARTDAASALGDLVRGGGCALDLANVVAALLRNAACESDPEALEATLYTLGEAADRPGAGDLADWDPLVPLLGSVRDPQCLGYMLDTLGLARHERYRAPLESFRTHASAIVREAAEGAIAELDHVPDADRSQGR